MSASLIGRLGSSTFRLSTTAMSMSPRARASLRNRHGEMWKAMAENVSDPKVTTLDVKPLELFDYLDGAGEHGRRLD